MIANKVPNFPSLFSKYLAYNFRQYKNPYSVWACAARACQVPFRQNLKHQVAVGFSFPKMYLIYLITFYQRIVDLWCHAKNFPNDPRTLNMYDDKDFDQILNILSRYICQQVPSKVEVLCVCNKWLCPNVSEYELIFTFPLRVFKWTFTFEMWFIPSWTNRFKPHPHTRHLSGLTSNPSNNVACLQTFAWRWTRIAMTLSAFWLFQTLRYVWFNSKYLGNKPS